jgi:hypothetical protein
MMMFGRDLSPSVDFTVPGEQQVRKSRIDNVEKVFISSGFLDCFS